MSQNSLTQKIDRIVITGGSGLLALNWACCMRSACEVLLATHIRRVTLRNTHCVAVDLEVPAALEKQLRALRPDVVIHTAGLTSVDECERNPEQAWRSNLGLTQNIVQVTQTLGVSLIHISTDHLFAGDNAMLSEEARTEPLNEYARSKLAAEVFVLQHASSALILRTNFFGWGSAFRQSFTDWIIDALRAGRPLRMFDDVHFSPILADSLARTAHALLLQGAHGIYHVCGDERISKHAFSLLVANRFGLPEILIERANVASAMLSAARPRDMSLSNKRAREILGHDLGGAGQHVEQLWAQERTGRHMELKGAVT